MSHTEFDQRTFNRQVADVLSQLVQEVSRIRTNKSLSNLNGISLTVEKIVESLVRDEMLNRSTNIQL